MPATVQDLVEAGFTAEEIAEWSGAKRKVMLDAGFTDREVDEHLTGIKMPEKVPSAFANRVVSKDKGLLDTNGATNILESLTKLPTHLFEFWRGSAIGTLADSSEFKNMTEENGLDLPYALGVIVGRMILGSGREIAEKLGKGPIDAETYNKLDVMDYFAGAGFGAHINPVGRIPYHTDIINNSFTLSGHPNLPYVEKKLLDAYENKGLLPQEVTEHTWTDPTVHQEMLSVNPGLPERYNTEPWKPIEVFHGTPHTFGAEPGAPLGTFDLGAINTGEGAQAYGHGFYFAESQQVAEQYRQKLGNVQLGALHDLLPEYFKEGNIVPSYGGRDRVLEFKDNNDFSWSVKVQAVDAEGNPIGPPRVHETMPSEAQFQEVLGRGPGNLYSVRINASRERFLDWDKPLSEQPLILEKLRASDMPIGDITRTGADWYDGVLHYDTPIDPKTGRPDAAAMAKRMQDVDIAGIRYLDRSSRGTGEGTSNWVVFHPKDLEITGRNGEMLALGERHKVSTDGTTPEIADAVVEKLGTDGALIEADRLAAEHDAIMEGFNERQRAAREPDEGVPSEPGRELAAGGAGAAEAGVRAGERGLSTEAGGEAKAGTEVIGPWEPSPPPSERLPPGGQPPVPPERGALPAPPEGPKPPLSLEEANALIDSRLSVGERDARRRGWRGFVTDWLDELHNILRAVPDNMPAELNPLAAYRHLSGIAAKAHNTLFDGGVTKFYDALTQVAKPLAEIMEPVRGRLAEFRRFAAAAHSIELESKGIKTGIDQDAALMVVRAHMDEFADVFARTVDFQNKLMWENLVEPGIISREAGQFLIDNHLTYIPFYRALEPHLQAKPTPGMQPRNPLQAIVGSAERIIDPLESIVKNTYLYTQMGQRNHAAKLLTDMLADMMGQPLQKMDIISSFAPRDMADFAAWMEHYGVRRGISDELAAFVHSASETFSPKGYIAVFREGERSYVNVGEDLASTIRGLDKETADTLSKFAGSFTNMLRVGSLMVPEFAARHLMREYEMALATAPGVFSPWNMVKGFVRAIKHEGLKRPDAIYDAWVQSSAANVSLFSFDRAWLQEDLRKLTIDGGLMTRAWNVMMSPTMTIAQKASVGLNTALHPFQVLMEAALSASHLGAFERAMEREGQGPNAVARAAWESRMVGVDDSIRGAKVNALNLIIAFFNSTLQEPYRLARALDPRNPLQAASTSLKLFAGITVPSLLLWAINHDDPDYNDKMSWEKNGFWQIPIGWAEPSELHKLQAAERGEEPKPSAAFWVTVPKPFGAGVLFGSLPERILDAFKGSHPEPFRGFWKDVKDQFLPGIVPTVAAPIYEAHFNQSIMTGRPLIPESLKKQLPEYQYTPYTSELGKQIGKIIGKFSPWEAWSPIAVENLVRGWTGQGGMYVLQAADLALRKSGYLPDPNTPEMQLKDWPIIRAFIARYPAAGTDNIDKFYENYNKLEVLHNTWGAAAKRGDPEAMRRVMEVGGNKTFMTLKAFNDVLKIYRDTTHLIHSNPDIPANEQRQMIDKIYSNMTVVAKQGNDMMRQIEKSLEENTPAP